MHAHKHAIHAMHQLQTTNNKQQPTNNKQQTTNNKQQTTNNKQHLLHIVAGMAKPYSAKELAAMAKRAASSKDLKGTIAPLTPPRAPPGRAARGTVGFLQPKPKVRPEDRFLQALQGTFKAIFIGQLGGHWAVFGDTGQCLYALCFIIFCIVWLVVSLR